MLTLPQSSPGVDTSGTGYVPSAEGCRMGGVGRDGLGALGDIGQRLSQSAPPRSASAAPCWSSAVLHTAVRRTISAAGAVIHYVRSSHFFPPCYHLPPLHRVPLNCPHHSSTSPQVPRCRRYHLGCPRFHQGAAHEANITNKTTAKSLFQRR